MLFPLTIYNVFRQIRPSDLDGEPLEIIELYYEIFKMTERGTDFWQYEQDEKFRQYVDNFLIEINMICDPGSSYDSELNSPKKIQRRNRKGAVTTKVNDRKDIAEMKADLKERYKSDMVERYSDDLMILRKCIDLVFTSPNRAQLRTFINSIRRYLLTQRVNRHSQARLRVMAIQEKLIDEYSRLPNERATVEFTLSAETINDYIALVIKEKIRPAVRLLKRFIGLGGRKNVQEIAADLLITMENAVTRKIITRADPYYGEILNAISALQQYIGSGQDLFMITPGALHGLDGLCNENEYGEDQYSSMNGLDDIDDY